MLKTRRLRIAAILAVFLLMSFQPPAGAQKEEKSLQKVLASKNMKEIYEIRALRVKSIAERSYQPGGTEGRVCGAETVSLYDPSGNMIENELKKYDAAKKRLEPVQKWTSRLGASGLPELETLYYYDEKQGGYAESKKWAYEYDERQNLVSQTMTDVPSGAVVERIVNKYDEKNNRVESVRYEGGKHSDTTTYKYDENRNELESVKTTPGGEVVEKIINSYDEAGIKTETAVYAGSCLCKKIRYNRLACETETEKYSGGKLSSTIYRMYDDSGNKTEETEITTAGARLWLETRSYDQLNNLTEKARYGADGTLEWKEAFKYDELNRKIGEYYYTGNGGSTKLSRSVANKFNDLRQVVESASFDGNGKPLGWMEFAYEYNQ